MRVLIADDQPEVCLALRILLEHEAGLEITGEVHELSTLSKVGEYQPDLLLLDWELPNLKVFDAIPILRHQYPELKIIALSVRPEAARAAISAGVDAFVSKGENSDKLLETVYRFCR